jgi:putative sigma-54 modulation protein
MQIHMTARGLEVPQNLKELLEEKAEKLNRFGHDLSHLRVTLWREKYLYTAETTLSLKGVSLVGQASHPHDLITCVEQALAKLERQLKRRFAQRKLEKRRRIAHRPA